MDHPAAIHIQRDAANRCYEVVLEPNFAEVGCITVSDQAIDAAERLGYDLIHQVIGGAIAKWQKVATPQRIADFYAGKRMR